jgi:hypothetical protein
MAKTPSVTNLMIAVRVMIVSLHDVAVTGVELLSSAKRGDRAPNHAIMR